MSLVFRGLIVHLPIYIQPVPSHVRTFGVYDHKTRKKQSSYSDDPQWVTGSVPLRCDYDPGMAGEIVEATAIFNPYNKTPFGTQPSQKETTQSEI